MLMALGDKYTQIEVKAHALLVNEQDLPTTKLMQLFRGFARKINTGIAEVAGKTDIIRPQDIPKGFLPLGLFSAILFFSFASIALLCFLYVFANFRFSVPKTSHILAAAFLCLMVLLLGFAAFMYLFLGKTSNDATLSEYLADFNSRNSTAIIVDLGNSSLSDAQAMRSCAFTLADSIAKKNKTWAIYTMTATTCTQNSYDGKNASLTLDQCQAELNGTPSSFLLSYSPTNEPPRFSVIYQNEAEIHGNMEYYASCPIVALFN
jgi:hypothetical protein